MLSRNFPKSLALISIFALGGCQFIGSLHLTGKSRGKEQASELAVVTYGPATQQGRDYLRSNLTGLAIDAFNLGLASGEDPAAAYNGLGVAYARLGRTDVAYRFFRKATISDPGNQAYAHNLTSLVNSPAFTLNLMARELPAPVARNEQPADAQTAQGPARAVQVPGKLYRENNRQFSLITVALSQERTGASVQSAANDACSKRAITRSKQRCGLIPLPKVGSRSNRTEAVALAAPDAPAAQPSGGGATAAPATKAKSKVLDLSGPKQTGRVPTKAKPDRPAGLADAT